MKFLSKFCILLIGIAYLYLITSCHEEEPNIAVTDVTLNATSIYLEIGQTHTLKAELKPNNLSGKQISWESSNKAVVTVSNGVINAVGAGNAVITASCDGVSASCNITVVGKHKYLFGYAYSDDLLKFLTPTITIALDGQEPVTYTIKDGNNNTAEDKISYAGISLSVSPKWAKIWWLGSIYNTAQKGSITISYERKDIDYSAYDELGITSSLNLLSKPFVDKTTSASTISIHNWISITIGSWSLEDIIDNIVSSPSNTVTF